ncbi:MAG: DUF456 family protein [Planctomycetes bacterium]|nr:DUF456 family protein [Planctomycetota bacterium]
MTYVWATIVVALNLLWLSLVFFGLPGNWLMALSAMLTAWLRSSADASDHTPFFSIWTLTAVVLLATLGELAEFWAGVVGTAKAGGTRRGALGALVGGMVGAVAGTIFIPVPVLGSLLGGCAGACIGAWWLELRGGRDMNESMRAGVGAGVGMLAGRVVKVIAGVLIWLTIAVAAFWP